MKLVVGLGNPGPQYAKNRHNVGFMVIDELLRRAGASTTTKFKGEFARANVGRESVVLLKPQTFMNLSGISVGLCASFFSIAPEDTVVVHDELDLEFGDVRIKKDGGHAGHNGLRSMFQNFAPGTFGRVRVGIGRPNLQKPADYVLSNFAGDELIDLGRIVDLSADAVRYVVEDGIDAAMNRINRKK